MTWWRAAPPCAASTPGAAPVGVIAAGSDAEAVIGADLVLSVNSASEAVAALTASIDALEPGTMWADLNTASPAVKRRLAALGREREIPVTDIAMMAPVPGKGLRVPMLASGDADYVAVLLRGYGADIEVLDGPAGLAATRKLLRSVFYKGMSASIVEALEAAGRPGLEDWLRPHIVEELAAADASTWSGSSPAPASTRSAEATRWRRRRDAHRPGRPAHHGRRQPRPPRTTSRRRITARSAKLSTQPRPSRLPDPRAKYLDIEIL